MVKLKVEGLEFAYDSAPVLKEVNLEVKKGEILGLVGPNASGKTTLIKCLNRILEPQTGSVFLKGKDLAELEKREIARKIGYVPQMKSESLPTTVFDTILMGRRPHCNWKPSSKDLKKVSEILNKLDLEDIAMKTLGEISGGQKQKVLIARALAQEPEILLLDEPKSNLDLKHQLEVMDLIKYQTKKGISVVMALHDLNLASRYSDKLVMLKEGKIFAEGNQEILNPKNIESVYGVKVSIEREDGERRIVPKRPVLVREK